MQDPTIEKGRCKQILKASSFSTAVATGVGAETRKEYDRIMSKLLKFKKESKNTTKTNTQKAAWYAEQEMLSTSLNKNESDLSKIMNQVLLNAIGDERMNVHQSIQRSAELMSVRDQTKKDVWNQFHELKSLLTQIFRVESKSVHGRHDNDSHNHEVNVNMRKRDDINTDNEDKRGAAKSIFAELLMNAISSHSQQWQDLVDEERSLSADLHKTSIYISKLIQSDRLNEQNKKLRTDLCLLENEDYEVEVFVNDWIKKLEALDKEFKESTNLLCTEHNHRCSTTFGVDPQCKYGGWDPDQHALFVKIFQRSHEVGSRKKRTEQLIPELTAPSLP